MLGVGISDIAVPVAVARIVYSHGTALLAALHALNRLYALERGTDRLQRRQATVFIAGPNRSFPQETLRGQARITNLAKT